LDNAQDNNNNNNNNNNRNAQPAAQPAQQPQAQQNQAQNNQAQPATNTTQNRNATGTTTRSVPTASSSISPGITQPFSRSSSINSFTLPFNLTAPTSNVTIMNVNIEIYIYI